MIEKLEKKFDSASFSKTIEELVQKQNLDYMDAILYFCEVNGLEVEAAATLVKRSEPIKQKLEAQVKSQRLLNRGEPAPDLSAFQKAQ